MSPRLFLLSALISIHASAAEPVAPPAPSGDKAQVRVACVGDSITQGSGAGKGKSYPTQLQELLGDGWKVGNFGVSARTLLKKGDHPVNKPTAPKAVSIAD